MNYPRTVQALALLAVTSTVGCGGSSPTNTVETKEDAAKILSAMSGAESAVAGGGETACADGGTVKMTTDSGVDFLKGEVSTSTTYTFTGCVSEGVTLSGSWSQILKVSPGGESLSNSGHVDTSLGSCIIDLQGTTTSSAVTGTFCGFDYNTLSS